MTAPCDQVGAFADGELSPAEAEAFREHLAGCASCQADLRDLMMLKAVEPAGAAAQAPAPVISLAWYRKARTWVAGTTLLAAAAAIVLIVRAGSQPPVLLAQASTRAVEERISYGPADRWRPYDVMRGGGAGESVSAGALAKLEDKGDLHGVAAGYLLSANSARAGEYLSRAGDDPSASLRTGFDVKSDRAVVALMEHRPADALALCDEVLAKWPRHPQALWNRALALRDLNRNAEAADAFDKVAALGESGWSEEAKKRAEALRH
jgi:hypothetical protein